MQIAGAAGKDAQVHKLVAKLSPHYRNTYSLAGTFTFELPARDTKLSQVFADMIAARKVRRPQRRHAETVMPCMPLASYSGVCGLQLQQADADLPILKVYTKQTPRCLTPKPTLAHAGPGADELGHLFLHAGGRIHQDCSAGSGGCAVATIDRDSGPARSVLAQHPSFCQK